MTIAVLYGFRRRGSTYFHLSGFDPEYARFSAGKLPLAHAIRHAIAEGRTVFDFLSGQEAYKYQWGARDYPTFQITFEAARKTADL